MPLPFEALSDVCSLEFPDSSVSPRRWFHGSTRINQEILLVHSFAAIALQNLQNLCLNPAEMVGVQLERFHVSVELARLGNDLAFRGSGL